MYDHEQRYFLKHKRGYFSKGCAKEHMDSLAQNTHAILLALWRRPSRMPSDILAVHL